MHDQLGLAALTASLAPPLRAGLTGRTPSIERIERIENR